MPKYLGPANIIEHAGKWYRVGDNIPMNKETVDHMAANGHRFEGTDPALESGTRLAFTPTPPLAMPHDDRGQQINVPADRHTAAPAAPAGKE